MSGFENSNSDGKIERRREPRYAVEIDVLVISGVNSYRTKTVDVSEGGCRLRTPIPSQFTNKDLKIIFLSNNENHQTIRMKGGAIVDESRSRLMLKPWMNNDPQYFGS